MKLDPITLSVLASRLAGIAEEMGAVLIRGAFSANIKERRDCSAALFDARGRLVAQAEHIPVHLGAMPESVAAVMREKPAPGEVFIVNDPFAGGSHLPDITMVMPLTVADKTVGFAATRAHHNDVGGMRPGSMPADSQEVYQEGLILPPLKIAFGETWREDVLRLLLANVRTPEARLGDLRAQLAACRIAEARLTELRADWNTDLAPVFTELIDYSARRTRAQLRALPDGDYRAQEVMEGDGVIDADIPIRVHVRIRGGRMVIDFAGTAKPVAGNVNCPLNVTRAACYFALRVLLGDDTPANAGCYAPVEIRVPENCLLDARRPAAVVAGNVETSQRVADVVLTAFAKIRPLPAQGQGTMNNIIIGGIIGTAGWSFYETLAGGLGAGPDVPGPSARQAGMTNTLNTPIEVLEMEYPLRVRRYEIAQGSGGRGRHRGGDGLIRSFEVLSPAWLSLISDRRRHAPHGARGGQPGRRGRNLLNNRPLAAKASRKLEPGDVITVHTPGGGGYGKRK